jgi:Phage integrase family
LRCPTTAGFARMVERAANAAALELKVRPHMLRHACGYALANQGHDTRAIQAWLGHRSITSTAIYTALAPNRFKDFWRNCQPGGVDLTLNAGHGHCENAKPHVADVAARAEAKAIIERWKSSCPPAVTCCGRARSFAWFKRLPRPLRPDPRGCG